MRAIGWIAEKSNFHKGRKNWAVGNELTIDEAREQANKMQMNHWARKGDKIQLLADNVLELVTSSKFMEKYKCRNDKHNRQHLVVEEFVKRNSKSP